MEKFEIRWEPEADDRHAQVLCGPDGDHRKQRCPSPEGVCLVVEGLEHKGKYLIVFYLPHEFSLNRSFCFYSRTFAWANH